MEGQKILTLNPGLLDDKTLYSFNDLRALCKKLGLGGNGSREALVQKLVDWHKCRIGGGKAALAKESEDPSEYLSMNINGSNFSLLGLNVKAREDGVPSHQRTPVRPALTLLATTDSPIVVSPVLLRPFEPTPSKSPARTILKTTLPTGERHSAGKGIKFSPFNSTKMIAHRKFSLPDHDDTSPLHRKQRADYDDDNDDDDDDGEENNYVDEEANQNAARNATISSWRDDYSDSIL